MASKKPTVVSALAAIPKEDGYERANGPKRSAHLRRAKKVRAPKISAHVKD